MRPSLDDWTRTNKAAALVAIAALSMLVWQGMRTVVLNPLPRPAAADRAGLPALVAEKPVLQDGTMVLRAVARNPLRHDRRRAAGRYRPPDALTEAEPKIALPPPPQLSVVGVAVGSRHRQLAALSIGQRDSRLLAVGDTVHGFAVTVINRDQVLLARSDTVLTLAVPDPFRKVASP